VKAEALLPNTDALLRGTAEFAQYGIKWLVRYRRTDGTTWRQLYDDPDEADRMFNKYVADLEERNESTK
jgi:hypothetical protein